MRNLVRRLFAAQNWLSRPRQAQSMRLRRKSRLALEALEDRYAPAVLPLPPLGAGLDLVRFPIEAEVRRALHLQLAPLAITILSPAQDSSFNHDIVISGALSIGNLPGVILQAQTDGGAAVPLALSSDGHFSMSTAFVLNGAPDNAHTIVFSARDGSQRTATRSLTIHIDTTAPAITAFDLDPASDTGTVGDRLTSLATVSLHGTTEAGAAVVLTNTGASTKADSAGHFAFAGVGLAEGPNALTVQATDAAGNHTVLSRTITRDSTIPAINAALANDTGSSSSDGITSDPTVTGTVAPFANVTSFRAGLDDSNVANFVDVTSQLVSGAFTFDVGRLTAINHGNAVSDGSHTLRLQATNANGNASAIFALTFTLDRSTPTLLKAIPDIVATQTSAAATIDLAGYFTDTDLSDSLVRLNTSAGPIDLELFDRQTPQTVANFFNYIQDGTYDNTIFHRLVANFVLQGGGFTFDPSTHALPSVTTLPPVPNEFGISNTTGTVAMAKLGGDPNSATSQFFFNLGNNSSNLDNQNGGFTVFGKLAGPNDQAVLNALAATPTFNKGGAFTDIPLKDYAGTNFPSDASPSNFLVVQSVTILKRVEWLTYSIVSNSNPALVTASLNTGANEMLSLQYAAGQTGFATITVQATDRSGASVNSSFQVSVG